MSELAKIRQIEVRREGDRVVMLEGGRLVFSLPWNAALDVAGAIIRHARRIEEIAKREQIVRDQAILNRAGIRLGLIADPHLQREAMSEAAWNSDLRRYMPGGIKSQEIVGVPTLIGYPAKKETIDGRARSVGHEQGEP